MVIGAVALGGGIREHGFVLPALVGVVGLAIMGFAMTLHESGYEPAVTILGGLGAGARSSPEHDGEAATASDFLVPRVPRDYLVCATSWPVTIISFTKAHRCVAQRAID